MVQCSSFISGNVATLRGYKDVRNLKVGEVLVGPDGEHRIVGFIHETLGSRYAVRPDEATPNTLLTEDHVIMYPEWDACYVYSEDYRNNYNCINTNTSKTLQATHYTPEVEDKISVNKLYFIESRLNPETVTISPVVDYGGWVYLEGGRVCACLSHRVA